MSAHYGLQIERQYRDSENYYAGPARNTMSAESYYAGLYFGRISKAAGMAHHAQMTENDSNIMRILCGNYAGCSAGGFWIFWPEPGTLAEASSLACHGKLQHALSGHGLPWHAIAFDSTP